VNIITIFQHFFSVFQVKNQEPHQKCPLHASRDLYRIQEGNKTQEYAARWVCNFCGKAFYSEHYLDKHFENKHSDQLVKVRSNCFFVTCIGICSMPSTALYLRWLEIVSSTYILMGRYDHSLSLDATIMVSKNCPTIGEHVVTIFVTQ